MVIPYGHMRNEERSRKVYLPPEASGIIHGFRNAGYTTVSAVADLVDNSVSAGALHVDVLLVDDQCQRALLISDDGHGMTADVLVEAMRLSSRPASGVRKSSDLGRYGIGMKAASLYLSRIGEMSVDTLSADGDGGRAGWSVRQIEESGWTLHVWPPSRMTAGTTVRIEEPILSEGNDASHTLAEIAQHLGLAFGRLIRQGLQITVQGSAVKGHDLCSPDVPGIRRLGPWSWDHGSVRASMLILPPALGPVDGPGGRRAHAGLHLRRGGRAITWGGWYNLLPSKLRDAASDRLRLCVDIPPGAIDLWNIDISKTRLQIPPYLLRDLKHRVKEGLGKAGRIRSLRTDAGQPKISPDSPWDESGLINRDHEAVVAALGNPTRANVEALLQVLEDTS